MGPVLCYSKTYVVDGSNVAIIHFICKSDLKPFLRCERSRRIYTSPPEKLNVSLPQRECRFTLQRLAQPIDGAIRSSFSKSSQIKELKTV